MKHASDSRGIGPTLTTGPVFTTLLRMTASMLIGFVAGAAFNLTDTYFVSRLGTAQLAAMGYTFPIVMTVYGLIFGIGIGTSSVLARLIGQADRHRARQLTEHALLLGLVVTGAFIVAGWLTLPRILTLLGADAETLPLSLGYLRIWLGGMIFLVIPILGNNAIRATGDTLTPSLIMTVDMVLNIILDPIFIFGFGPLPAMGIRGAALATVLARALALVASLVILYKVKRLLVFERCGWRALFASWGRILHVGLPAAATNIMLPVAAGVLTRLISAYGTTHVAAFSAGVRIEHIVVIPLIALGASLVPFVGQNWGAKRYDRVAAGIRLALGACAIWGGLCTAALGVFSGSLAPFFSREAPVLRSMILYLRIVPIAMAFRGISHSVCNSLNAIGRPLHSAVVTMTRLFGLQLPLALLGSYLGGFVGLLIGVVCSEVLAATFATGWMWKFLRRAATAVCESPALGNHEACDEPLTATHGPA